MASVYHLSKRPQPHYLDHGPYHVADEAARQFGRDSQVCIGVSGGKDSIVTLALCRSRFASVRGYFLYTIPGLSFQENFLCHLEKLYDCPIDRLPNPHLTSHFKSSTFRHPTARNRKVRHISIRDIENHLRSKHGTFQYVAVGEKGSDSMERQAMIRKCGGIDHARKRIYPLSFWNDSMVYSYIRQQRLPMPVDYHLLNQTADRKLRDRSFVPFASDQLLVIRERYPDDYDRIMRFFPFLEANVFRYEQQLREAENDEASEKAVREGRTKTQAKGGKSDAS